MWITIEQVKDLLNEKGYARLKYVRINNEFRFADLLDEHKNAVKEDETAKSAGQVVFRGDKKLFVTDYSMTLKIGPADDDEELLAKLFDMTIAAEMF